MAGSNTNQMATADSAIPKDVRSAIPKAVSGTSAFRGLSVGTARSGPYACLAADTT
jgi:hypothetical protein